MPGSTEGEGLIRQRRVFLGRLAEDLSDLIASQSSQLLKREGIAIPVKSVSLVAAIAKYQPATAAEIATQLERSHQLVSQKLPKLVQLDLLEMTEDPQDARRKLYKLTQYGAAQLALFEAWQIKLEQVYLNMAGEYGDVNATILKWIEALTERPLAERQDSLPN